MFAYVLKRNGVYRVMARGRLLRNAAGTPVDGGGHATRRQALAQALAITRSMARAGRIIWAR